MHWVINPFYAFENKKSTIVKLQSIKSNCTRTRKSRKKSYKSKSRKKSYKKRS